MVYMTFPSKLSEQEEELKRKFAQLRKLKKQLAQIKAATSRPPESDKEKKNLKRTTSEAAEAATEQAKKLLKSGVIKVDSSNKAKQFKRARTVGSSSKEGLEKQSSSIAAYKPYNVADSTANDESEGGSAGRPSRPNLRDNFVPASAHRGERIGQPRRGPIVFVRGQGITETMLKETFTKEGLKVIETRMEIKRHSNQPPNACFVTFDTTEAADDAVAKFNGAMVGSITLDVEIARKQKGSFRSRINYDKNNPEPPEPKSVAQPNRDMVSYEDDDMFG